MIKKSLTGLILVLLFQNLLFGQAATNIDYKWHNVGKVKQLIVNVGYTGNSSRLGLPFGNAVYCEYPIGSGCGYSRNEESGQEHLIGSILSDGKKVVSTSGHDPGYEFFPTEEPWDTIWVVQRGEVVDIPYWPGYKGISDQDFVCRYSDDQGDLLPRVQPHLYPQYLDIIQTSHAWSIPPFDEWILYQYYITPTKFDLKDVYVGYWFQTMGLGKGFSSTGNDDCNKYYPELNMMSIYDTDQIKDDNGLLGPIGMMIFPPDDIDPQSYTWCYSNVYDIPDQSDETIYNYLSENKIYASTCDKPWRGWQMHFISFGPLTLNVGDTLHYMVGQVLGVGEEGLLENAHRLQWLKDIGFKTPGPPPNPPLRVSIANHQAILKWDAQPGDVNPETWTDSTRLDQDVEPQPFEGYRIYKSTQSTSGPWTLLAEFDVEENAFFSNTGLVREFMDNGLVNNLEYYYTVTSFTKPDVVSQQQSLESNKNTNAVVVTPGTAAPTTVTDEIAVVPNPYRGDVSYKDYKPAWELVTAGQEWFETDRRIQFINIPSPSEIKIYTLAGDLVRTIEHNAPTRGFADWNLTSMVGQTVASGIYLYTVEDQNKGNVFVGKFVIIK